MPQYYVPPTQLTDGITRQTLNTSIDPDKSVILRIVEGKGNGILIESSLDRSGNPIAPGTGDVTLKVDIPLVKALLNQPVLVEITEESQTLNTTTEVMEFIVPDDATHVYYIQELNSNIVLPDPTTCPGRVITFICYSPNDMSFVTPFRFGGSDLTILSVGAWADLISANGHWYAFKGGTLSGLVF